MAKTLKEAVSIETVNLKESTIATAVAISPENSDLKGVEALEQANPTETFSSTVPEASNEAPSGISKKLVTESSSELNPKVIVSVADNDMPKQTFEQIAISKSCTKELARDAVFALLKKGAAASSAPDTLSVSISHITEKNGKKVITEISLSKGNFKEVYRKFTKNTFLRRFAETFCKEISKFAEINNLHGDLAQQMSIKVLSTSGEPLTPRQKAWASSFNNSRSLHFFLAAWPVIGIWFTALGLSTMAFNLNGLNFNQSVVDSQGRVLNTWADIINRANLGMEVMHERNAHNFPLDLASTEAPTLA